MGMTNRSVLLPHDDPTYHRDPTCFGAKELLDRPGVEGEQVSEAAVRQPAAIGERDVEMRMPAQQLASGLEEADGAGDDRLAVEGSPNVA
jgi:hypothetical protein